jgi:hypothetical protein
MKKCLVVIILLIGINLKTTASSILASSFGFNNINVTTALQNAIQSNNDTIIIDLQSSNWKTGSLNFFNLTNKTIIFQKGVVVEAIPGLFNDIYACLFRFFNAQNVQLIGYGATLKMNKAEYATLGNSEYRHSINIDRCNNFTVKGLTINESGGDGVFVGGDGLQFSKNILIEDVVCNNHYRQGMSITNVEDMTVRHCKFANTKGTLPEAGVDVEPYQINQRVINLKFEKCRFENNGWSGIALALFEMDSTSLPVSITVSDCYFKNNCLPTNTYSKSEIFLSADANKPVKGNVLFERCVIDSSQYSFLYTRKTTKAYKATFKNCAFNNVSGLQSMYNNPIFLEVPDYSAPSDYIGGLRFENVFISYVTNLNFFRVFGWSTLAGIKDITGNFTVVEPNNNPVLYSNVADTVDVNFTFTNQTSLPATTVQVTNFALNAFECNQAPAINEFTRTSSNTNYSLGIVYGNSGTATLGDDFHYPVGALVFPPTITQIKDSVFARNDKINEPTETFNTAILPRSLYALGGNTTASNQLFDCVALNVANITSNDAIAAYPNPAKDMVYIKTLNNVIPERIEVYTIAGERCLLVYKSLFFNTSKLANGSYVIKVFSKGKYKTISLIVAGR